MKINDRRGDMTDISVKIKARHPGHAVCNSRGTEDETTLAAGFVRCAAPSLFHTSVREVRLAAQQACAGARAGMCSAGARARQVLFARDG